MFFKSSAAAALLTLFSSTALAIQSKPFYLVLSSSNKTLDGHVLSACHIGAAFESLCVGSKLAKANPDYDAFQYNYTRGASSGILTWELQGSGFNFSEGMQLYTEPSTNVALATITPESSFTQIGFDKSNSMYIPSYYNDMVSPPVDGKQRKLYRWWICEYNYSGYVYNDLCWQQGHYPPENPTCQKVDVMRSFEKN